MVIARHVRPITMVVDMIDVACLIHASLPLWVRAILDWVQRDGHARSGRQILRAQGGERHVSNLLHSIIHVSPDGSRRPWAPIMKRRVGWDIDVDLVAL
jgi:hypothetical protein